MLRSVGKQSAGEFVESVLKKNKKATMAVRLAADLRPSADGSTVHISLVAGVAKLQAASMPTA